MLYISAAESNQNEDDVDIGQQGASKSDYSMEERYLAVMRELQFGQYANPFHTEVICVVWKTERTSKKQISRWSGCDQCFSHSGEKAPLWDQVPTEAIWLSKLTFFLNVKFVFYKPFKYKRNKYLSLFDIFKQVSTI